MTILIDADACPVVKLTERVAAQFHIPVVLFCDTNHVLSSGYSEVRTIGAGADAVDFAIVNACRAGDLVITQDYGLASMVLGKRSYALHQSGMQFTEDNISGLLMDRYTCRKARMASAKHHLKGPAKRTRSDDIRFEAALTKLLRQLCPEGEMT